MALFENLVAANKLKSVLLVIGFILFYTAVIFAVAAAIAAGVHLIRNVLSDVDVDLLSGDWHATAMALPRLLPSGIHLLVMAAASNLAALVLAAGAVLAGPGLVLSMTGARSLGEEDGRTVQDVVDEMALATGVPSPNVAVVDSPSMNAFSVGYGGRPPTVVLSRGLLERLKRDELEAVVAHEIARIKDYDTHLMTLIAGLVGLATLAASGVKAVLSAAGSATESDVRVGFVIIALLVIFSPVLIVVLFISPLFGRLIQLAVSRERQFLADAEAARMTRLPEALAKALEILATDTEPTPAANRATAPLFIVAPLLPDGMRIGGDGTSVWSSHPPVEDRAARLRSIGNVEG